MPRKFSLFAGTFLLATLVYFSVVGFSFKGADFYRHWAIAETFRQNPWHPQHEALSDSVAHRELHTPYHALVGWCAKVLGLSSLLTLEVFAAVNWAFLIAALCLLFFRRCRRLDKAVLLTAVFVFIGLFLRWDSNGFGGELSFYNMHWSSSYPATFALGLLFLGLAVLETEAEKPRERHAGVLGFLLALCLLTYPLMGVCFALQMGFAFWIGGRRTKLHLLAAGALALVLAYAWPFYPVFAWKTQLVTASQNEFYPYENGTLTAAAVFILCAAAFFLIRRPFANRVLLGMVAASGLIYGVSYPLRMYFFSRFIVYFTVYAALLLTYELDALFTEGRKDPRLRLAMQGLAAVLGLMLILSPENRRRLHDYRTVFLQTLDPTRPSHNAVVLNRLAMQRHYLHAGDVVLLSNYESGESYRLCAATGAKVVFARFAFLHPQALSRRQDVERFFATDDAMEMRRILQTYGVTAVLIDKSDVKRGAIREALLNFLGRPTDENLGYFYYRVV